MRRPQARAGECGSDAGSVSRTRRPCSTWRHRKPSFILLLAAAVAGAALWLSSHPRPRTAVKWESVLRLGHRFKQTAGSGARVSIGAGAWRLPVGNHRRGANHDAATSKPQIRALPAGIDPPGGLRPCPVNYPRLTKEQIAAGEPLPYLFGGQPPGCKQCRSKGHWSNFCQVRPRPACGRECKGSGKSVRKAQ